MAQKTALPIEKFSEDLVKAVHNFATHTFKAYLTNAAVSVSAHTVKADVAEIATGNGYAGPITISITVSRTGSLTKIVGADPAVITASGGSIGPFRAVVFYNDTPTSPADPLIVAWDYGSSITLQAGETFPIDFDDTNGIWSQSLAAA